VAIVGAYRNWQAAYANLLPDAMLVGMSDVRQSAYWSRVLGDPRESRGVFVADDEDMGVVGFGSCGPARDMPEGLDGREVRVGEVYTLYVEPDFQNRGLGRRLLDAPSPPVTAAIPPCWMAESPPVLLRGLGGERVGERVDTCPASSGNLLRQAHHRAPVPAALWREKPPHPTSPPRGRGA
jgi:GNAT superfamily N-acetyltransferase